MDANGHARQQGMLQDPCRLPRQVLVGQQAQAMHLEVDGIMICQLHMQRLRLGLLHQAVLGVVPVGRQRVLHVLLRSVTHASAAVKLEFSYATGYITA